jgi:hypothetical protein
MSAINYFTASYGTSPWVQLNIYWGGVADVFRLYEVDTDALLYTGTGTSLAFEGTPGTKYSFRLEADVTSVTSSSVITVFTRTLPAPTGLVTASVTDDQVLLQWNTVGQADSYEIADVTDNYTVIHTTTDAFHLIDALTQITRYSYAVRSVLNGLPSKWSAAITFTTLAGVTVTAGVYEYPPTSIHCWTAGRPGSTDPDWRPEANDWYHGDGFQWGDNTGLNTTFFFYGPSNPFGILSGGVPSKVEVYLDRAPYGGDPGMVLSRWGLHGHATKPVSAPVVSATQADLGSFARAQFGWVELPLGWASTLISGFDRGVAWGNVDERFQVAKNTPVETSPRMGTIRVTVS